MPVNWLPQVPVLTLIVSYHLLVSLGMIHNLAHHRNIVQVVIAQHTSFHGVLLYEMVENVLEQMFLGILTKMVYSCYKQQ
jgi:hypothetical protein